MLALQRPSMGSSKPPNLDMPFGYNFDTSSSNFHLPSPTAPAPGPSLLDDNESKFLDSFFDGVSNDQFNYDLFTNPPDGSELGMGWDELPPAFMGTTSSFGQQPATNPHGLPDQAYGGLSSQMNAGPQMQPSTSADVLAAATLLQNGSAGRAHSMSDGPALFGAHDLSLQPANGTLRSQSISQCPPSRPQHGLPQRGAGQSFMQDNYFRDMVFGGDEDAAIRRRIANQKLDIRWGSDAGFASPQGFISDDRGKIAAAERSHIQTVENALHLDISQLASSAENTCPSSPAHHRTNSLAQSNEDERARKRRKSKPQKTEDDDEPLLSAVPKQTKRRKSAKKATDDSPILDAEPDHKRRKSAPASAAAAALAKATRENLTEDQKRENHIKSEQKRRSLIREGFEDLNELVPGLRDGGFSKSAVLIMTADWLEELIQGNQLLQDRLDQMEGR